MAIGAALPLTSTVKLRVRSVQAYFCTDESFTLLSGGTCSFLGGAV